MKEIENLTKKDMDIILHTSGLSRSKEAYRNRYVTQEDNPDLLALKEKGLMDGRHVTMMCTGYCYYLTKKGLEVAHELARWKGSKH